MPPRILILSASVGAGHVRAAQAIESAARQVAPAAEVSHVDVLQLATPAFRRAYGGAYLSLVTRVPHAFGWLYDATDKSPGEVKLGDRLRAAIDRFNLRDLQALLKEKKPDVVACTHFLPAEIVSRLVRKKKLAARHAVVTTDFDVHRLWVQEPADVYFAADDEAATGLRSWGIHAARIRTTGIPIAPQFSTRKDGNACRAAHGLPQKMPVVLQLAGGFGTGSVARVHEALLAMPSPACIVAVAGRNAEAEAEMKRMPLPPQHRRVVLGFTTEIDELMAAADLVVSKPGGLTSSECLARGVPMLIIEPIPGQETRNADYLVERGAALKANSLPVLTTKAAALLADAPRRAGLAAAASRIARPRAAWDVAVELVSLAGA